MEKLSQLLVQTCLLQECTKTKHHCQAQNIKFIDMFSWHDAKAPRLPYPCFQGHRLIAGLVVKEGYGAEKQQHTFSIEVSLAVRLC
jgi:hypothetical protein